MLVKESSDLTLQRSGRFRKLDSSVSMVESAKDWIRDNVSELFDWPSAGCVLPERNVRPHFIVIGSVFRKDSPKVLDVEHEQMIRALAPDRTDQAFNIAVLPGRAVRRGPVPNP